MTPDLINGLFEFTGSVFLWLNCWRLWKDKMVRGYSMLTLAAVAYLVLLIISLISKLFL